MATVPEQITDEGYRDQVLKVEPKGIEPIAASERHGRPGSLFSLWFAANVEFATLVTGVLATAAFGLSFAQALLAILVGNLLGAAFLGWLSTFGPQLGVPQLIQSRGAFGYYGNFLPGLLNFVAGFSWFAVNTVLGVFALQWLLHLDFAVGLGILAVLQVVIAIYGYNLIHAFERYFVWVLTAVFLIVSVYGFGHAHLSMPFNAKIAGPLGVSGAFILTAAIAFSYVLGWIPYASDYTRYLPADTPSGTIFRNVFAAMFVSGTWLETLGAAIGTIAFVGTPTDLVTHLLPHTIGIITMIGVVIGTLTANILNIYSGALSSLVLDLPLRRWMAALIVGIFGTAVAWFAGQHNYWEHYEVFLFLLGYWIAPWLAILAVDRMSGGRSGGRLFYDRGHRVGVGVVAWLVAIAASIPFMNQPGSPGGFGFVGVFAAGHPAYGDITYLVSFVLAGVLYAVALRLIGRAPVSENAGDYRGAP